MVKSVLLITVIMMTLGFSHKSFGAFDKYRKCITEKIGKVIKANPCKFDSYYAAEASAENQCADILMDMAIASGNLNTESVDAAKRAAFNDYEDMVSQEGKRCGVSATAKGSSITIEKSGVK